MHLFVSATASFWPQFWPALASGVLGSALTGLIVGLVLERARKNDERRHAHRQALDELVRFMSRVHPLAAQRNPITIGPAVGAEPPASRAISPLVEQSPIDQWRRILGNQPPLHAITSFLEAREKFLTSARRIDRDARAVIRSHNASTGIDAVNDRDDLAYLVATGLGASPTEVLLWIDMPGAAPRFVETVAAARTAGVTQSLSELAELRQSLIESVSVVASCTAPGPRRALADSVRAIEAVASS